jgi:hypothetical protein
MVATPTTAQAPSVRSTLHRNLSAPREMNPGVLPASARPGIMFRGLIHPYNSTLAGDE